MEKIVYFCNWNMDKDFGKERNTGRLIKVYRSMVSAGLMSLLAIGVAAAFLYAVLACDAQWWHWVIVPLGCFRERRNPHPCRAEDDRRRMGIGSGRVHPVARHKAVRADGRDGYSWHKWSPCTPLDMDKYAWGQRLSCQPRPVRHLLPGKETAAVLEGAPLTYSMWFDVGRSSRMTFTGLPTPLARRLLRFCWPLSRNPHFCSTRPLAGLSGKWSAQRVWKPFSLKQ